MSIMTSVTGTSKYKHSLTFHVHAMLT